MGSKRIPNLIYVWEEAIHNKLKVFKRTFLASTGHVDFISRMYLLLGPSPLEPWLGLDELGGCSACSWALDLSTNATYTLPAVGLEQAEEIFVIVSRLTQPDNDPIRLEIDAEHHPHLACFLN